MQEFTVGQKVRITRNENWKGRICTIIERAEDEPDMYYLDPHGWRRADEIEAVGTPTSGTIEALAKPLGVAIRRDDWRVYLYSTKSGGMASFPDTAEGRALAIKWINEDQRILKMMSNLKFNRAL